MENFIEKSIERMKKELDFLVKKYDPNLIYFVVDTFLAMSNREFDEMKELYSDYKIPFWMNTRAETINEYRAAGLGRDEYVKDEYWYWSMETMITEENI